MTHKVFWDDPYLSALDTTVDSVVDADVALRATVFYALSGGQESDAGTIAGIPVLEARNVGRAIVYRLPAGHGLRPGDPVRVEIDWQRRYRLMRLHFAAELVLELACRELRTAEKIGAHIAPDKARIDFAWPENLAPRLPRLAAAAQAIVDADLPIVSAFSDRAGERRYWELAGFARVPCGGTHLRRTGEVGRVSLKRRNIGKAKERVEVYAAAR
ncbi:MAG: alanyl-tRNA editing protein [Burkholderiales bacterium]